MQGYTYTNRFLPKPYYCAPGMYSDDSEMSIAIINSPLCSQEFEIDKDAMFKERIAKARELFEKTSIYQKRIEAYLNWANVTIELPIPVGRIKQLHTVTMGKNTRELFGSIKTTSTFHKRYQEKFSDTKVAELMQSNGAMMRSVIFADKINTNIEWAVDCLITNPSDVALECEFIYLYILYDIGLGKCNSKLILDEFDRITKTEMADGEGFTPNILITFTESENYNTTPMKYLGKTKGWCISMLYYVFCAIRFLVDNPKASFKTKIEWMLQRVVADAEKGKNEHSRGADTDTILAIVVPLFTVTEYMEVVNSEKDDEVKLRFADPDFAGYVDQIIHRDYSTTMDCIPYFRPIEYCITNDLIRKILHNESKF
jgi:hypothetical protein